MTQNQRSSRRYDCQLDIEVVIEGQRQPARTRNLSLGGIFIDAGHRPKFGTRVQLKFTIPTQKEAIEVGGQVRWVDEGGYGVQFDGLRARDVWALGKFFEQLPPSP